MAGKWILICLIALVMPPLGKDMMKPSVYGIRIMQMPPPPPPPGECIMVGLSLLEQARKASGCNLHQNARC